MHNWSFDILRQSGWDLWSWVCIFASIVLLCYGFAYAAAGSLLTTLRGLVAAVLILGGVAGTCLVLSVPALRSPKVGLGWTFLMLGLLSATFYLNLQEQLGSRRMLTLLAMRVLALALLVPMLFEPVWRYVRRPTPERPLVFLIDTSGSMSVPDVQNGPTRIQSVWQTIRPLLPKMKDHFIPRFYQFSTDCREVKKPEALATIAADGRATDIVAGVSKVLSDTTSDKDPAIVLVSDGNDNVSPNVVDAVRGSQRKIHTLSVGSAQAEPSNLINVAVDSIAAPDDVSVGHEGIVTATIKSTALSNRVVDVKMAEVGEDGRPLSADGKGGGEVVTKRLILQPVADGQKVDLPYTPHVVGVRKLAVWIDPIAGERNLADNRQEFQVLAIDPRAKVLYIEGALRPEYTYLNRMLGHDANLELATLLRLERDRFVAAGTVDGEPFKAMPATPEEWKKFDVVIVGDLDASFLSTKEQSLIQARVSDGGGLVMFGGQKNFGAGGYKGSLLEQALPVFAGDAAIAQEKSEFVPQLTPEGAAHPAMEGLTDWFPLPGKKAAKDLSPLKGNVVVAGAKSGAQVLLVHPDRTGPDGSPQIVLAVERYGKGRSAAFTADTTNVWYRQFREQGQDNAFNRFWGQLVRWLAGEDVRSRQRGAGVEGLLNKTVYQFGESVKIRAMVRDARGDTTQYAQVSATVKGPGLSAPVEAPMPATSGHVGMYEVVLPEQGTPGFKSGDFTVDLVATKDGKELGRQSLKFSVIPPSDEMLKIAANPDMMEAIATETAGFHRPLAELPELLETLIQTEPAAATAVERTVPLSNTVRSLLALAGQDQPWAGHYDLPMQGLLVISVLAMEWVLRRKWQLP